MEILLKAEKISRELADLMVKEMLLKLTGDRKKKLLKACRQKRKL